MGIFKSIRIKIILLLCFIISAIYFYSNFIINISPSEPVGIYKIERSTPIQRGNIVAVCLSSHYQSLGLQRDYLVSGIRCGKTAPLIKTVIAVPGDTVILKDNQIIINNHIYPYLTKYVDSHGRKLDVFPRGIYKNIKTYWLIGTNDPNSWDSRYWGGVERKNIISTVFLYVSYSHF